MPGESLSVTVDGFTYTAGDGHLINNANGTWELSIPIPLADGTYDITTVVTDLAGNFSSDGTSAELTVDTIAPVEPTVQTLFTSDTTPLLTGNASLATGEVLIVIVDGNTYTAGDGDLVDNGDGTWELSIPNGNAMVDGIYEVLATITDVAGNSSSDSSSSELTIDTVPPPAPTVSPQLSNNASPTVFGTATVDPGASLTVNIAGTTYTAGDGHLVDNGDGTWDLTVNTSHCCEGILRCHRYRH